MPIFPSAFGSIPNSLQYFTPFAQYAVSIALILFGVNFTLYYLILIGKIKDVLRSEELRTYFSIVFCSVAFIFITLLIKNPISTIWSYDSGATAGVSYTAEEAFRHSLFQVSSLITTAGFSTTDYNIWPRASKMVLLGCMFIGAMAGSTAGGIKTSRIVIAAKGIYVKIRKLINPRYVPKTKIEGKLLEEKTTADVFTFITLYAFTLVIVLFILCLDSANGDIIKITSDITNSMPSEAASANEYLVKHGFFTNLSAVVSCLSNIGPGFEAIGPYASFADYSAVSKMVLTLTMILGRLEFLPLMILFSPRTWKKI